MLRAYHTGLTCGWQKHQAQLGFLLQGCAMGLQFFGKLSYRGASKVGVSHRIFEILRHYNDDGPRWGVDREELRKSHFS